VELNNVETSNGQMGMTSNEEMNNEEMSSMEMNSMEMNSVEMVILRKPEITDATSKDPITKLASILAATPMFKSTVNNSGVINGEVDRPGAKDKSTKNASIRTPNPGTNMTRTGKLGLKLRENM